MNQPLKFTPSRPNRFRLYVDETGDHSYGRLDHPDYRYLALLGVWFQQPHADTAFDNNLRELKMAVFGSTKIFFHRSDIINKRGIFVVLRDKERLRQFNFRLLEMIRNADFRLACVVIDKQFHKERYSIPMDPYHYCLIALLERYCSWLKFKNAVGDIVAEARNKRLDRLLQAEYKLIFQNGTAYQPDLGKVLTSNEIKFATKDKLFAGLELADMLAYPIKQRMLVEAGLIQDPGENFGKELFEAIQEKFNCQEFTKDVSGYGKIWIPKFNSK